MGSSTRFLLGYHVKFYCFEWENMGCRGGIRWKIYSMYSFQDRFSPGFMLSDEKHIWIPIEFAGSWSNMWNTKAKNYCKKLSCHSILYNYFSSAPWVSHNFLQFKMAAVSVKRSLKLFSLMAYEQVAHSILSRRPLHITYALHLHLYKWPKYTY